MPKKSAKAAGKKAAPAVRKKATAGKKAAATPKRTALAAPRASEVAPDFNEYAVPSPNRQSRAGTKVDLWIIHTQEGNGNAIAWRTGCREM